MNFSFNNLICPYCGAVQQMHEPDEISADCCNEECEVCGKLFNYSVVVKREYISDIIEQDGVDLIDNLI